MKKRTVFLVAVLASCFVLTGCGSDAYDHRRYMGFDKSEYTVVEEEDTHGGFLGDGCYILILDCSSDPEKALAVVKDWTPLPLSENLNLIMFGGEKDGVTYGYELAEEAHWPRIEHGYYRFVDKRSPDPSDDSGLFDRHSFNFEIAAYDTDSNMLYYFIFDT